MGEASSMYLALLCWVMAANAFVSHHFSKDGGAVQARMFTISASIGLLQASGDEETASRLFVWVPRDGGGL